MTTMQILPAGQSGTINVSGLDAESRAVLGFLARYRNERTLAAYRRDLESYRRFLVNRCHLPDMLAATRIEAQLYVRDLQRRGLAEATVARGLGTVRTFYKYAIIDGLLVERDPTAAIETPMIDRDKQRRTWLTTLQMAQLLRYARRSGPRDHAMVVALGMLGLRIGEMCELQVTDVHRLIGVAELSFVGKGGKAALMDLPLEVLTAFDLYAAGRTDGHLFLSRDGRPWTVKSARLRLAHLVHEAGLGDVEITPHGLRRTAARTLQERGVELGTIQQFLRHKDPRVTAACYIGTGGGAASLGRATLATIYGGMAT